MNQNSEEIIYVSENDIPLTNTRKQFVRYFLRGNAYITYSDEECTIKQCKSTANRSITDLHKIIISRFPKTTFEAVIKIVKQFMEEDKSVILVWCTQINKPVIKFVNNKTASWISNHSKENYYTKKGVDGYSLKDYEEIMNKL
jgi:hypothetical protein